MESQADVTVLAGDVGGTKINLGLFAAHGGELRCLRLRSYPSQELDGVLTPVRQFLSAGVPRLHAAAFGVAGPVRNGRAPITSLPWIIDADELRGVLGIARVELVNDLQATAYGVLTLAASDFLVLNAGDARPGNIAVIAAGTGLGEGMLFWDGGQYQAAPSEGGHVDFAPRNALESELLSFLWERHGHTSYERLVSGPGLVNIYRFLRDTGRGAEPPWLAVRLRDQDAAAVIAEIGLRAEVPLCAQALDMLVAIYGAEAGNLALKALATAGVYVAGGIAPKIRAKMADGTFMAAFRDKGRMGLLMDLMPVRVVLRDTTALQGAAFYAARLARKEE